MNLMQSIRRKREGHMNGDGTFPSSIFCCGIGMCLPRRKLKRKVSELNACLRSWRIGFCVECGRVMKSVQLGSLHVLMSHYAA